MNNIIKSMNDQFIEFNSEYSSLPLNELLMNKILQDVTDIVRKYEQFVSFSDVEIIFIDNRVLFHIGVANNFEPSKKVEVKKFNFMKIPLEELLNDVKLLSSGAIQMISTIAKDKGLR